MTRLLRFLKDKHPSLFARNISNKGKKFYNLTYWLNLKEANAVGSAEWKELYKFTEYYGLEDLSAETLDTLAKTFEPGVDEA